MSTKSSVRYRQYIVINNAASLVPPSQSYGPTTTVKTIQYDSRNRTRTGVANPKWRSQIILGQNASTNFTASERRDRGQLQKYDRFNKNLPASQNLSHSWGYSMPLAADLPILPAFMSIEEADDKARQKFYKNAIKAQRFLQSGVFLGEIKQTLGLILSPAKSARLLVDVFVKSAKRRARPRKGSNNIVTAAQKLKLVGNAIADSWLQFSFGWEPLISDLEGACGLLASLALRTNQEFVNISGAGLDYENLLVSDGLTGFSSNRPYSVLQQKHTYREVRVKYYGRIRLDVPELADGRILSGLGLTTSDIIPTAWELIPWSFLIDYFTNIGDVIDAWSYPVAKLAWASKVVVENRQCDCFWSYNEPRTRTLMGVGNWISVKVDRNAFRISNEKRVTRTAEVYVRPPELKFELPFARKKQFNIAALFAASRLRIR
jgi:hypothetical protein